MAVPGIQNDKKSTDLILEYVLRHCNDDWVISELLRVLPFSNENLKLKKMVLLRGIFSELRKGSISEKTLETLQSLKDINKQLCKDSSNERILQELCCKVAVECTLKHLRAGKNDLDGYNDALKRLWSERIEDTEDVQCNGGISNSFYHIKKELVAVGSNPRLRDTLLENYKQNDVLKSLRLFLKDSWEELGPAFLYIVAEDVVQGRYNPLKGMAGKGSNYAAAERLSTPPCGPPKLPEVPENHEEITSTFPPPWADWHPSAEPDMSKERKRMACNLDNQVSTSKIKALDGSNGQPLSDRRIPDCQHIVINLEENEICGEDGSMRKDKTVTATQKEGNESVPDLNDVNSPGRRFRSRTIHASNNIRLGTPEFVQIKENLRKSASELHSLVEDPLPDSLQAAEVRVTREESSPCIVNLDRNKQSEYPTNEVEKNVSMGKKTGINNQIHHMEESGNRHQSGKTNSEPVKFNIMDRNPTACTYQWDEDKSIDSPEDNSPSASRQVRLPTHTVRHVSPLKHPHTSAQVAYRRKPTKWSVLEEETLRKEVAKYGKGRWKFILEKNRPTFEERTEVDLKDKWRNIERREGLHAP